MSQAAFFPQPLTICEIDATKNAVVECVDAAIAEDKVIEARCGVFVSQAGSTLHLSPSCLTLKRVAPGSVEMTTIVSEFAVDRVGWSIGIDRALVLGNCQSLAPSAMLNAARPPVSCMRICFCRRASLAAANCTIAFRRHWPRPVFRRRRDRRARFCRLAPPAKTMTRPSTTSGETGVAPLRNVGGFDVRLGDAIVRPDRLRRFPASRQFNLPFAP